MKRFVTISIISVLLASCNAPKHVEYITSTKPADSCLTNKQYKLYLHFVKDSMKIESNKQKNELKYGNKNLKDSLKIIRTMFDRAMKEATKQHKQDAGVNKQDVKEDGKTQRTQAKEEGKTERTQAKQEGKTERVEAKQDGYTARTQTRQEEKTKRGCKWWLWLMIGFGLAKIPFRNLLKLIK